jgi:hypothetical protein
MTEVFLVISEFHIPCSLNLMRFPVRSFFREAFEFVGPLNTSRIPKVAAHFVQIIRLVCGRTGLAETRLLRRSRKRYTVNNSSPFREAKAAIDENRPSERQNLPAHVAVLCRLDPSPSMSSCGQSWVLMIRPGNVSVNNELSERFGFQIPILPDHTNHFTCFHTSLLPGRGCPRPESRPLE